MISIIIPTFNEQERIAGTIQRLRETAGPHQIEVIISDGGSTDMTLREAGKAGADTVVSSGKKGRSAQMNYGASLAKGDILYFLHADTIPPPAFTSQIKDAVRNNYLAGCFRLSFDHQHWFLRANCWFTRFDVNAFRFGDQSLFIRNKTFQNIKGFCEKHIVLEDQEIIRRIKKEARFTVIQKPVITSARKYLLNGIYKTQGSFFLIYVMYRFGVPQSQLIRTYKRIISEDKI
jgi:rSAM/selenodomain-associated transferase 2